MANAKNKMNKPKKSLKEKKLEKHHKKEHETSSEG